MDKHIIFSDSIIVTEILNDKLDETILKILEEEEIANKGVEKSNFGGFQTNIINNFYLNKVFTIKAAKWIFENYNSDKKTNLTITNLWINKNFKGSFNIPHVHPKSNFSGVYYVDACEEQGKLVFFRNDKSTQMNEKYFESTDFYNEYFLCPKKRMFVLFPSHLQHMVTPNLIDKPRISVSFNFTLGKSDG